MEQEPTCLEKQDCSLDTFRKKYKAAQKRIKVEELYETKNLSHNFINIAVLWESGGGAGQSKAEGEQLYIPLWNKFLPSAIKQVQVFAHLMCIIKKRKNISHLINSVFTTNWSCRLDWSCHYSKLPKIPYYDQVAKVVHKWSIFLPCHVQNSKDITASLYIYLVVCLSITFWYQTIS